VSETPTPAPDALEIEQFLHTERLPHIWCPGCGIGIVTGAFLRAVVDLGLKRERTVVVGGKAAEQRGGYIDLGTVHAIHGRHWLSRPDQDGAPDSPWWS
jgi:pyruvate/2-oxoacid:ferredoxin oxidoreductase beta subunit